MSSLTNLITQTVAPKTWDGAGGEGTIVPFGNNLTFEISQTQDVHDEIVDLLKQLRERMQDVHVTLATAVIRCDGHGKSNTTLLPAVTLSNGQTASTPNRSTKGLSAPIEIQPVVPPDDRRKVKLTVVMGHKQTLTADVKSGESLWLDLSSGSMIAMPAQPASHKTEEQIGLRRMLLRVTPQIVEAARAGTGTRERKNGRVPASSPSPLLAEPPQLRFLAWQDDFKATAPRGAFHPNGSPADNPSDLQTLDFVRPAPCDASSAEKDHRNPRFLHLWFSHPL